MIQKWQIPHNLCAEVVEQAKGSQNKGTSPLQNVVLDLFPGGDSYRKAVEEAGYVYIPVDIKTLYGPTEDHCKALGLKMPPTAGG